MPPIPDRRWLTRLTPLTEGRRAWRRRQAAYRALWTGRAVFWGGAVLVGLLAVAFTLLSEWLAAQFLALQAEHLWLPLIATPLGGALCVWLTRRYFSGAEGSGIPQALAEMRRPEQPGWRALLSLRIIVGKIVVGSAAVGCGYSLGREGPTVQVGASVMDAIHRLLPKRMHIQRNHLLVAGGAAGIAAAFNTPLAGVIFAIEEMSRGVETRMSGLIITAIVLAGVVSKVFLGGGHYFGHLLIDSEVRDLTVLVVASALTTGVAGGLFARMLILSATGWEGRLARLRALRPLWFAALCGLLVAALGLVTDGATFGSGYEETRALLHGEAELPWYFGPAKFVATLIAYLSGLPGGIFSPSLAIGAGIGHGIAPLFDLGLIKGTLLALCMAGFLAAVTQAPITSFVIVMEMVDGYGLVIGLMATTLLSSAVSRLISAPLYATLAQVMIARQRPPAAPS